LTLNLPLTSILNGQAPRRRPHRHHGAREPGPPPLRISPGPPGPRQPGPADRARAEQNQPPTVDARGHP